MNTEIIFNIQTNHEEIISRVVNAYTSRLLTEDAIFPELEVNASLVALQAKVEKVEIDENNNVRKIFIGKGSHEDLLLG